MVYVSELILAPIFQEFSSCFANSSPATATPKISSQPVTRILIRIPYKAISHLRFICTAQTPSPVCKIFNLCWVLSRSPWLCCNSPAVQQTSSLSICMMNSGGISSLMPDSKQFSTAWTAILSTTDFNAAYKRHWARENIVLSTL